MAWNPEQYEKFKSERTAPFDDLLKLVEVKPGVRAIDLGCGTGELTRKLADTLPDSEVTGLDSSASMLARSGLHVRPGLRFIQGDIAELKGSYDLIFSNAALQWLPDHRRLFPKLWRHLNPGGQLVVQMPANHDHPSHRLARELAESAEFAAYFPEGGRQSPVLPPEAYAEMLFGLGGEDLTVLLKIYPHILADAEAMVEWVKGTLLTAYLEPLPPPAQERFLGSYRTRLRELFPRKPVFYGFKRILFSVFKPG